MADAIFVTLLFIHIIFVVAWLGASLFGNIVLFPLTPKLSLQGRSDFSKLVMPGIFRYQLIAGVIAMIDGVLLYIYINFGNTFYATSPAGLPFIQAGAIVGLFAAILVNSIQNNAMRKIQKISAQTPSEDDQRTIGRLQNRLKFSARTGAALLVIVLIWMVVGSNI